MFSVIFEVHPRSDQWDAYLGYAKMLMPGLEQIDGFVDYIRYRSLMNIGRKEWHLEFRPSSCGAHGYSELEIAVSRRAMSIRSVSRE